ncbi:hypothetical protein [Streptomyces sp. VN1]|nr:hypothetical protein [Streptomyces sp. VN1]
MRGATLDLSTTSRSASHRAIASSVVRDNAPHAAPVSGAAQNVA